MKYDAWYRLRKQRDALLVESDRTQLSDFPIDTKTRALFKEYRTYLRDLPRLFNDDTIKDARVKTFEQWLAWRRGGNY